MPYTEEEKRLRRNEANRKSYQKHKEKRLENRKEYYQNNKEKQKEYYENNKEKVLEYYKEYKQTENGKRNNKISTWKYSGLIVDDYDTIYDRWLNSVKCEMCDKEYKMTKKGYLDKCLEHNHTTGEFRSICCISCNGKMRYLDEEKK